jgi:ADP-ribosylation factor-like protein 8
VVPTVGFNVRNVRKGNITLKIWDIAGASLFPVNPPTIDPDPLSPSLIGQPKFRSTWERYCNGVDVIIFIVDSHDVCLWVFHYDHFSHLAQKEKFDAARFELHQLLSHQTIAGVPLLVVCSSWFLPSFLMGIYITP